MNRKVNNLNQKSHNLLNILNSCKSADDLFNNVRNILIKEESGVERLPSWLPDSSEAVLKWTQKVIELEHFPSACCLVKLLSLYAATGSSQAVNSDMLLRVYLQMNGFAEKVEPHDDPYYLELWHDLTGLFYSLTEYHQNTVLSNFCLVGRCLLTPAVNSNKPSSVRGKCLKDLNELMKLSPNVARDAFRKNCDDLFIRLPRLLEELGDYDLQVTVVEAIYRMTPSHERSRCVTHWFPNLECPLQSLFIMITEFDPDCRRFLNAFNSALGQERKVYTFPCNSATVGQMRLTKPQDPSYQKFWVDFNLGSETILLLCQKPYNANAGTSFIDHPWESLVLDKQDIQKVTLTRTVQVYSLEVLLKNSDTIADLFASQLSQESRCLLSDTFLFEFAPLEMLERVCSCIFKEKFHIVALEPEGWVNIAARNASGQSGEVMRSSGSSRRYRKCSMNLVHCKASSTSTSDPKSEIFIAKRRKIEQVGTICNAHLPSSQASSVSCAKKHRKSSVTYLSDSSQIRKEIAMKKFPELEYTGPNLPVKHFTKTSECSINLDFDETIPHYQVKTENGNAESTSGKKSRMKNFPVTQEVFSSVKQIEESPNMNTTSQDARLLNLAMDTLEDHTENDNNSSLTNKRPFKPIETNPSEEEVIPCSLNSQERVKCLSINVTPLCKNKFSPKVLFKSESKKLSKSSESLSVEFVGDKVVEEVLADVQQKKSSSLHCMQKQLPACRRSSEKSQSTTVQPTSVPCSKLKKSETSRMTTKSASPAPASDSKKNKPKQISSPLYKKVYPLRNRIKSQNLNKVVQLSPAHKTKANKKSLESSVKTDANKGRNSSKPRNRASPKPKFTPLKTLSPLKFVSEMCDNAFLLSKNSKTEITSPAEENAAHFDVTNDIISDHDTSGINTSKLNIPQTCTPRFTIDDNDVLQSDHVTNASTPLIDSHKVVDITSRNDTICTDTLTTVTVYPATPRDSAKSPATPRDSTRGTATPRDRTKSLATPRESTRGTATPRDSTRDTAAPRDRTKSPATPRDSTRGTATPRDRTKSLATPRDRTKSLATPRESTRGTATPRDSTRDTAAPRDRTKSPATPRDSSKGLATPIDSTKSHATPRDSTRGTATPRDSNKGIATPNDIKGLATPRDSTKSPAIPRDSTRGTATPRDSTIYSSTPNVSMVHPTTPVAGSVHPTTPVAGPVHPTTPVAGSVHPTTPVAGPVHPTTPVAGSVHPTTPVAGSVHPTTPVAGSVHPTTPVAGPVHPTTPVAGPVHPTTPVAGPVHPTTPVTGSVHPTTPVAGSVHPTTPVAGSVHPTTPVAGSVHPTTPVAGSVHPTTPVAGSVHPTTPVAGSVHPTTPVAGSVHPTTPVAGSIHPTTPVAGSVHPTTPVAGPVEPNTPKRNVLQCVPPQPNVIYTTTPKACSPTTVADAFHLYPPEVHSLKHITQEVNSLCFTTPVRKVLTPVGHNTNIVQFSTQKFENSCPTSPERMCPPTPSDDAQELSSSAVNALHNDIPKAKILQYASPGTVAPWPDSQKPDISETDSEHLDTTKADSLQYNNPRRDQRPDTPWPKIHECDTPRPGTAWHGTHWPKIIDLDASLPSSGKMNSVTSGTADNSISNAGNPTSLPSIPFLPLSPKSNTSLPVSPKSTPSRVNSPRYDILKSASFIPTTPESISVSMHGFPQSGTESSLFNTNNTHKQSIQYASSLYIPEHIEKLGKESEQPLSSNKSMLLNEINPSDALENVGDPEQLELDVTRNQDTNGMVTRISPIHQLETSHLSVIDGTKKSPSKALMSTLLILADYPVKSTGLKTSKSGFKPKTQKENMRSRSYPPFQSRNRRHPSVSDISEDTRVRNWKSKKKLFDTTALTMLKASPPLNNTHELNTFDDEGSESLPVPSVQTFKNGTDSSEKYKSTSLHDDTTSPDLKKSSRKYFRKHRRPSVPLQTLSKNKSKYFKASKSVKERQFTKTISESQNLNRTKTSHKIGKVKDSSKKSSAYGFYEHPEINEIETHSHDIYSDLDSSGKETEHSWLYSQRQSVKFEGSTYSNRKSSSGPQRSEKSSDEWQPFRERKKSQVKVRRQRISLGREAKVNNVSKRKRIPRTCEKSNSYAERNTDIDTDNNPLSTVNKSTELATSGEQSYIQDKSADILRHTSKSSLESNTPNMMDFNLIPSKGKDLDDRHKRVRADISEFFGFSSPETSEPCTKRIRKSVEEMEVKTFVESNLPQQLGIPSKPKPVVNHDIFNIHNVPGTPNNTPVSVDADLSTQTFDTREISEAFKNKLHTQSSSSGPLQSTLIEDNEALPFVSAARFSYVSEAETSYVEQVAEKNNIVLDTQNDPVNELKETFGTPDHKTGISSELKFDDLSVEEDIQEPSDIILQRSWMSSSDENSPSLRENLPQVKHLENEEGCHLKSSSHESQATLSAATQLIPNESHNSQDLFSQDKLISPPMPSLQNYGKSLQDNDYAASTQTSVALNSLLSKLTNTMFAKPISVYQQTPNNAKKEQTPVCPEPRTLFTASKVTEGGNTERTGEEKIPPSNENITDSVQHVRASMEHLAESIYRLSSVIGNLFDLLQVMVNQEK
ncbi:uncharacterized protein [Procambarus clarkii]|uniref:uncharacterized protein n=1 Tax=Procambarus clarkii TaxID=6728 RepID=UPI003743A25C